MGFKEIGLREGLQNVSTFTAFFDVTITNTNTPVSEGDILTIDYSVNNTGDVQGVQDIRLEIDSVQEDVDSGITLNNGVSTTGTLQWDTTNEALTNYTATVLSNDDSDTVTIAVESAEPNSVLIDDFEDQSFSEYTEDTADWFIETANPIEGSSSATPSGSTASQIYSGSGLPNYPQRGDTIRVKFRSDGSNRSNNDDGFGFGLQGSSLNPSGSGYAVTLAPDNTGVPFGLTKDNFDSPIATDNSFSVPDGQVVEIEIAWGDPTITARIYDGLIENSAPLLAEISINDTTYDSGGIAFHNNSGSYSSDPNWDHARFLPNYIVE